MEVAVLTFSGSRFHVVRRRCGVLSFLADYDIFIYLIIYFFLYTSAVGSVATVRGMFRQPRSGRFTAPRSDDKTYNGRTC